jgi:predicted TIM-barrel fold metal-dependent hydrolase
MLLPSHPSALVAVELIRAVNDWTIQQWLSIDHRLHALALIPTQIPDQAAVEIRRIGTNSQMVGVLMAANPLGKPFGHPIYEPIYKAAADMGLTIVIHTGGDATVDTLAAPTAAGMPGTYAAYHVLSPQALMAHVVTLIGQGVPERYPTVKFVVIGGGAAWVVPQMWRFDTDYKAFRLDSPWLKDLPSAYFRKSFRVGTYPFDYAASADQLASYFGAYPGVEDVLCYASGYPDWDCDTPAKVEASLPPAWWSRVMRDNARQSFRWDIGADSAASEPRATET